MIIPHYRLQALAEGIFAAAQSEPAEAQTVAEHLVEANLQGHDSHGVGMIPHYMRNYREGTLNPNHHARFVSRDGGLAVMDGNMGYGQVVAREATRWAIEAARASGLALVALRNAHHIGRVGAYGQEAADQGMISLHFVNVVSGPPRVAPFRGSDGRVSTNPVCIAIPGSDRTPPILLDFATSKVALGKVRVAHNEGRMLPDGVLIDAAGAPTNDPGVIYHQPLGAVLPFGEHKGGGLALIAEILGGALTGGGTIQPETPRDRGIVNGMLTIVIDPGRLVDLPWFRHEIEAVIAYVKASPPAADDLPVLVPGEPERLTREKRRAEGIPVDATTWRDIREAAASVGLATAEFDRLAGLEGKSKPRP